MSDIYEVRMKKRVKKYLKTIPIHIVVKLEAWIEDVMNRGLSQVRQVTAYHDELLKGARQGQRSIRLSRAYRAIYVIENNHKIKFIEIIEVSKHEY